MIGERNSHFLLHIFSIGSKLMPHLKIDIKFPKSLICFCTKSLPLLLLVVVLFHSPARAVTWLEAIDAVQEKADLYWEYGRTRGAFTSLGTSVNELDVGKHRCAILGRMLGQVEVITHLEEAADPKLIENLSQDELQAIMYYSRSLSNWAYVASRLVDTSEEDKKYIWNLNCVGEQGIPTSAFIDVERPAGNFKISGTDLWILGDIETGFFEEVRDTIIANPDIERVVLGSGGGSVVDAIRTGLLIREEGLTTTLSDNCFSACPLVFLGGVERKIWSPYPKLGFHQIYTGNGKAISYDHQTYKYVYGYIFAMGADANFVLSEMLKASPSEMNEPDMNSLCDGSIATWVQRACFAPGYGAR